MLHQLQAWLPTDLQKSTVPPTLQPKESLHHASNLRNGSNARLLAGFNQTLRELREGNLKRRNPWTKQSHLELLEFLADF